MAGLGRYFYPRFMNEETEAQRTPVTYPKSHRQEAAQPLSISTLFWGSALSASFPALTWKIGD